MVDLGAFRLSHGGAFQSCDAISLNDVESANTSSIDGRSEVGLAMIRSMSDV